MASEPIDGVYITGRSLRCEILRKVDELRYDWDDDTFKSVDVGWTERRRALVEDSQSRGWYRVLVDPATWDDGEYIVIVDDADVHAGLVSLTTFSVVSGQFARTGAGLARAVWVTDVDAVDQVTLAGARGATWLGRLLRRFALLADAKFTRPVSGVGSQVLYDGTDVIATISEANDGTTSTIEDPV